jgi:hypothetical protein
VLDRVMEHDGRIETTGEQNDGDGFGHRTILHGLPRAVDVALLHALGLGLDDGREQRFSRSVGRMLG